MDWFDRAAEEIENDLTEGRITEKEYQQLQRELREEYRASQCRCDDIDA